MLSRIIKISITIFFAVFSGFAYAYVAGSENYRIDADTVTIGGTLSTTTAYSLWSVGADFSGEISTNTSYGNKSGFLHMTTPYLAVSSPLSVAMSPGISTSGGGAGNGSASWTITTDSAGGYSMTIKASTAPALASLDDSFSNYVTSGGGADYNWTVGRTQAYFGFTPEGTDITSTYKDNGVSCGVGALDTSDKCWASIDTTSKTIAQRSSPNHPSGTAITVKFRAEAGGIAQKKVGSYSATITVTVLPL